MNVWKFIACSNNSMASFIGQYCLLRVRDHHLIAYTLGTEKVEWMFKTSHLVSFEDLGQNRVAHTANSTYTFEKVEVKESEFGYGGHFCCSDYCAFHRNTHLYWQGREVMISTVGELHSSNGELSPTDCTHLYETLVVELHDGEWDMGDELDRFSDMNISFDQWNVLGREKCRQIADKTHNAIVAEMALRLVLNAAN